MSLKLRYWRRLLPACAALLLSWQVQAGYQCEVEPRDDIAISPQSGQVTGASGNLRISPQGDVTRDGEPQSLTAEQRRQARDYQAALRVQLPWIDDGARRHLEKARTALDRVVVQELGDSSNVRNRLSTLDERLSQQMDRVMERRGDTLTFHHRAVAQAEQDGRQIVQQALGGVLQDSLNEMGARQMSSGGNPLQAVMGQLGGLQQAVQAEWNRQEQEFQTFGRDLCGRVTALENQRRDLLRALP